MTKLKQIYHYTTLEGLQGIAQSGWKLRTSDPRELNDASELVFARTWMGEWVDRKRDETGSRGGQLKEPGESLLPVDCEHSLAASLHFEVRDLANYDPPFVACFCEHGDSLTLWRSYARDGNGFVIGIDVDRLGDDLRRRLIQCEYPKDDIKTLDFLERAWQARTFDPDGFSAEEEAHRYVQSVRTGIYGIKHPAFKDECEVRLLDWQQTDRETGILRQFAKVQLPPEAIRWIRIGPSVSPRVAFSAVTFVRDHGFSGEFLPSKVPFSGLTQLG